METNSVEPMRQMAIEAVITRADGRKEYLGTIDYYHSNPLVRFWYKLTRLMGSKSIFWRK